MDKLFGIAIVIVVSLLLVFGIFEIGIFQYEYYIEKGFREETASLFSMFGLFFGGLLATVIVLYTKLLDK
jgi:hypothetical protein